MDTFEIYDIFFKQKNDNSKNLKEDLSEVSESDHSLFLSQTNNISNKEDNESYKNSPTQELKFSSELNKENIQKKKIKNRESAKRYRQRHKMKFILLEKENERLRKELKTIIEYLNIQLCTSCKNLFFFKKKKKRLFVIKKE